MKAFVFDGVEARLRSDLPVPVAGPGEALVQVLLAGICNTDLEIVKGYMGFAGTLGHEFVGVVAECGSDPGLVGRRVVGEINCPCGSCPECRAGRGNHCRNRTVLGISGRDGAFAEFLTLPAGNLHIVPDGVQDEEAVFVEPLAAALRIPEQARISPSDRVAVLGDGKLGLLVAQVLAAMGSRVTAVGRHPEKLATLAGRGIEMVIPGTRSMPTADVVVECTGRPEGLDAALELLRPQGTLILKSTYAAGVPRAQTLAAIVINEIAVVGSRCGPFEPALEWLSQGRIDVKSLISATYPLGQATEAFDHARRPGTMKVLLKVT